MAEVLQGTRVVQDIDRSRLGKRLLPQARVRIGRGFAFINTKGGTLMSCALQVTVNRPAFVGTAENPQTASITWNITNLPPCYEITESEVTFTITRNNQPNVVIKRTVTGAATNVAVNLVNALGSSLATPFQPNAIVGEVRVKAKAIDPHKTRTESNTLTI